VLDLFGVLFSTAFVIFVAFRAITLDRTMPWFPVPSAQAEPDAAQQPQPVRGGRIVPSWRERARQPPHQSTPWRRGRR